MPSHKIEFPPPSPIVAFIKWNESNLLQIDQADMKISTFQLFLLISHALQIDASLRSIGKSNPSTTMPKKNDFLSNRILREKPQQEGCRNDFVCPANSQRKPDRDCYDTIDDCICDWGYVLEGDECKALPGLCSDAYAEYIERALEQAEFWTAMAESDMITDKNKVSCLNEMSFELSKAYSDFVNGEASCESFGEQPNLVLSISDRRLRSKQSIMIEEQHHRERQLRLRDKFKRLGKKIKQIAKKAIDVVIKVVDIVVDVVKEIAECGVGIVKDGAKCGLVGCAFGLVGVALDVAFTIATGGMNKAVGLVCDIRELVSDDANAEDDNTEKRKKQSAISALLEGIGGTVCAINEKIGSPVLENVCRVSRVVEDAASTSGSEFAVLETFKANPRTVRFLKAFKTAMCGNPGKGILDLLEEVVVCEIDCADDSNVFCPAVAPISVDDPIPATPTPQSDPTEQEEGNTTPQLPPVAPELEPVVSYVAHVNRACRTASGGTGREGQEFKRIFNVRSRQECEDACNEHGQACLAYEYQDLKQKACEIWEVEPIQTTPFNGLGCFVKEKKTEPPTSAPISAPATLPFSTYEIVLDHACRTPEGTTGTRGQDFVLFQDITLPECQSRCTQSNDCFAFEYQSTKKCEIWRTKPTRFDAVPGLQCHVKSFED